MYAAVDPHVPMPQSSRFTRAFELRCEYISSSVYLIISENSYDRGAGAAVEMEGILRDQRLPNAFETPALPPQLARVMCLPGR